jgi:DNA-binding transcriptional ArsR family regulator
MTHPLRRRLLSLLKLDGPSTASVLAQRTGQAVGNISHHLHALAAADLIEEVPELARDRRERWWRRTLSSGVLLLGPLRTLRELPSAPARAADR